MLSVADIFHEIHANDEAYRFFLSVAAKGEHQGGWENQRIAELAQDDRLRPKIVRHGQDEDKHGRLFGSLLTKRGLQSAEVPLEADYCLLLERAGIGLSHQRLEDDRPLEEEELLRYLVHSRVTEQRAAEEIALLARVFGDHPEIGPVVRMIADDEVNHLSFCHEELQGRLRAGQEREIRRMLRRYARAEVATYRAVSGAFVTRMARILGWSRPKLMLLRFGVFLTYQWERLISWRRMVTITDPVRPGAMD